MAKNGHDAGGDLPGGKLWREYFRLSMKLAFGTRAETALVNLVGSRLGHMLLSERDCLHVAR
jgi:hypothetical protein